MIRVSTKDIIDILPYGDGKAILVEKKPLVNSAQFKAEYSVIDFENKSKNVLTKNAYLLKKFGSSFKEISETIPNFVQCDAGILYDKRVLVIYPNGEAGIFSREGELSWSGYFNYHDEIVSGLALDGKYFWSICPSENSVIRYYSQTMQVDLRIGGKDASTFLNPTHISADSGDIFVCCGGNKVRRIDGNDFTVSDYLNFDEQIKQYHRFGNHSIAVLSSGTYLLDE
ncbi:hypothetical protein IMSAG250_00048 [Clostridiales bacterium]|nr:hypothetical protein [Eubacterium sp.]GFI70868.1 hypothetical protein IMSAG250_00048 [Clostridiales bacterium]